MSAYTAKCICISLIGIKTKNEKCIWKKVYLQRIHFFLLIQKCVFISLSICLSCNTYLCLINWYHNAKWKVY